MAKNSQVLIDIGQGLFLMPGLPKMGTWDTKGRPQKPKVGTFGFNLETKNLEYWDGNFWWTASLTQV